MRYHETPGTYPARSMRPTYIPSHTPGIFLTPTSNDAKLFAFLHLVTRAFTVGVKEFHLGPYSIRINVTARATNLPNMAYKTMFHTLQCMLSRAHFVVDVMNHHIKFTVKNENMSPVYDICLNRPYETVPRPPLNKVCEKCEKREVRYPLMPCFHFICRRCAANQKMRRCIDCFVCGVRIQCVIHFLD